MLQEVGVLSYSGYSLFKGQSMAMRYSPNGGAGARTIVIKLLMIYGPVSRSFMFLELQLWNCWIWIDMLNCMCCFWVGE